MKEPTAQPQASAPKPESKEGLKTLSMPELEKRLGSSPNELTQAEAATRLNQYGPNEIEGKKRNPLPECLSYFWFLGSHSLDDRGGGDSVGGGAPLARLRHHPPAAPGQCRGRILGGTPAGYTVAALKAKLARLAKSGRGNQSMRPMRTAA
jgi:hypothetical protein